MASVNDAVSPFGKRLAATDKKVRDKAVKSLGKWLASKGEFSHLELLKLWKGLFYCMWMSDKPLIQQQLTETLASLILKIPRHTAIAFIGAFWETMCKEWHGIDRLRLDKFYLLLRRSVNCSFRLLAASDWDPGMIEGYCKIMLEGPLSPSNPQVPNGIRYHITEIYLEELEKVVPAEKSQSVPTTSLLVPFFGILAKTANGLVFRRVAENIFEPILRKAVESLQEKPDNEETEGAGEENNDMDVDNNGNDRSTKVESPIVPSFDYDLAGIQRRLFAVGADPETLDQNRRKVYSLYQAYANFCQNDGHSDMEMSDETGHSRLDAEKRNDPDESDDRVDDSGGNESELEEAPPVTEDKEAIGTTNTPERSCENQEKQSTTPTSPVTVSPTVTSVMTPTPKPEKKVVQWSLQNNTVMHFHTQIPISPITSTSPITTTTPKRSALKNTQTTSVPLTDPTVSTSTRPRPGKKKKRVKRVTNNVNVNRQRKRAVDFF